MMELTLNKLIDLMLKKIWLIVLIVIISGISAFAISSFVIQSKYSSSTTVMIIKTDTELPANITQLKADYMEFTRSDVFLANVDENLNTEENLEQYGLREAVHVNRIKEYLSVNQNNTNSSAFDIVVVAEDPNIAYSICREIEKSASQIYKKSTKFRGTDIEIINEAKYNAIPISPNVTLNTVVGVFLGIVLSFLVIIVLHMIDNSVKDESDLVDNYNLPLLGVVYTNTSADELMENGDNNGKN